MGIGRFRAGIGALLWSPSDSKYLLLRRSEDRDFAGGVWECCTGRVDQGEGFEDALHREVHEELGATARIDFIVGTAHFYRGDERPENELLGIIYFCTIDNPAGINIGAEHSEYRWVTPEEAYTLLSESDPSTRWARSVIKRAEAIRALLPPELLEFYREHGFETSVYT